MVYPPSAAHLVAADLLAAHRRAVPIIARQIVGGLEPGQPALAPDMHPRREGFGPVEAAEIERDIGRILRPLEQDLAAAIRAEAAEGPSRGPVALQLALGHFEGREGKLRRGLE